VVAEQTGSNLAGLKRNVMREMETDGGVTVRAIKPVREHRPTTQDGDTVVRAA
jgi:hypothetical protein